jgi:putative oxidoreductase
MSLVRRFARPLLAASFVSGGIDTLRNPGPRVPSAEKVVSPLVAKVPQLSDVEQVVKIDAAIKVVAGTMFALGKFPRLSAAALIASLVPTTAAAHRFWEESDPAKRKQHQLHFLKNAGIVGGLMLAAVDTEGRPSLAWRAQHAPRALSHAANDLRRDAELALHSATGTLREATGTLHSATGTLHGAINPLHGAAETLHGAIKPLRGATGTLHAATESLQSAAQSAAGTLRDRLPV